MKKYIIFIVLIVTIKLVSNAYSEGVGSSSGMVLNFPTSARAVGMAESYGVAAEDVSSLYYNPANLSCLKNKTFSILYRIGTDEDKYTNLTFGQPLLWGSIGIGISYLDLGDIQLIDSQGEEWNKKAQEDYIGVISYSKEISKWFSFGVNLKYLSSAILQDYKAKTFSYDAGILFIYNPIRFGITGANLSGKLKYINTEEKIPKNIRISLGYVQKNISLGIDFKRNLIEFTNLASIGGEYSYSFNNNLGGAIRCGYRTDFKNKISDTFFVGLGIKWKKLNFDYAIGFSDDLDKSNAIGLRFEF